MKKLIVIALLLFASCNDPVQSGKVVSKRVETSYAGAVTTYYITISDSGNTNEVQVTQKAWEQAKNGTEWPFEVK